jgi:BASS family bile acid:Na+ symporter
MLELISRFSDDAAFVNSEIVPWVLRLVMAGLGLSLSAGDFRRVIVFPRAASIGLVAQLVGLPLAAFGLALLFRVPPAIAVGLVILAACPSGVTANAYTFAARADVPLCVTLSALTSVITVFTIPFLIGVALDVFGGPGLTAAVSATTMLLNLMTFTLIPLALGMLFRHLFPSLAERAIEPIRQAVLWLMIGVLLLGVVSSFEEIADNFARAGIVVIAMNLLTMGLGFGAGRLFRLPTPQVVTITFEVGVQNLALALAIAYNILDVPEFAISALIYAAVMPATALGFVSIGRRLIERERASAAA